MNTHVLQHVPSEGIGNLAGWLDRRGASVTTTRFFESTELPDLDGIDLIIAMGGPMSVNNEEWLPWLIAEKAFLREAMERGIAVLGICLGAQLIASACGARVYPGRQREIGWFEIEALPSTPDAFSFPGKTRVLHWHGETFDLPAGAVHLARSAACEHQAFQIGRRVLGLQFHPEVTPESVASFVELNRDELVPGEFVQSEAELTGADAEDHAALEELSGHLLQWLLDRE